MEGYSFCNGKDCEECKFSDFGKLVNCEFDQQSYRQGVEDTMMGIYEKMDEGVCEICEYNDVDGKNQCYKNCTHEFETFKSWLGERMKEHRNGIQ